VASVIAALFADGSFGAGAWGAALLLLLGVGGTGILLWRARREMTP